MWYFPWFLGILSAWFRYVGESREDKEWAPPVCCWGFFIGLFMLREELSDSCAGKSKPSRWFHFRPFPAFPNGFQIALIYWGGENIYFKMLDKHPFFCNELMIHWHLPCRAEKTNLTFKTATDFPLRFLHFWLPRNPNHQSRSDLFALTLGRCIGKTRECGGVISGWIGAADCRGLPILHNHYRLFPTCWCNGNIYFFLLTSQPVFCKMLMLYWRKPCRAEK